MAGLLPVIVTKPGVGFAPAVVGQVLRFTLDFLPVEFEVGRRHLGGVHQVDAVVEADLCHVVFLGD